MCSGISFSIICGNMSSQARETNKKTSVTISKLKALHTKKPSTKQTGHSLKEKIFENDISDKGLIRKIYKKTHTIQHQNKKKHD